MQARWSKQYRGLDSFLSDELKKALETNQVKASDVHLFQASNPCWYRYEVPQLDRLATGRAIASVRVFEHQWGAMALAGCLALGSRMSSSSRRQLAGRCTA